MTSVYPGGFIGIHSERGRRHKTVVDWARQAVLQAKRWLPDRRLVVVADAGFSGVSLIAALRGVVQNLPFLGYTGRVETARL